MECLVIGAGTAGTTAALQLAKRGIKTTLVDRRSREKVGASWINGVEEKLFEELQAGPPPEDVVLHRGSRFIMASPCGNHRQIVARSPLYEINMRALNAWLLQLAEEAGVALRFRTKVEIGEWQHGTRSVSLNGRTRNVAVVIDSAGLRGELNTLVGKDICSAYQGLYHVDDPHEAIRWMAKHRIDEGDVFSRGAISGGYSILNLSVFDRGRKLSILTGALHEPQYLSGRKIADNFLNAHPWVGKRILGGGGLIPLVPTRPQFVDDGLVYLGNAAGQVFPTHGSGVALGMRAAGMAARTIANALVQSNALTQEKLWTYNLSYQRHYGALCALNHALRCMISSLDANEASLLIRCGIIGPASVRAALAIQLPAFDIQAFLALVRYFSELKPLFPRLATMASLALQLYLHLRSFPSYHPGNVAYRLWEQRYRTLMESANALYKPSLIPMKEMVPN